MAPAPGGAFTLGTGTTPTGARCWRTRRPGSAPGCRGRPTHAGWGLLVRAVIEHVEIGPDADDGLLAYLRGRYRAASAVDAVTDPRVRSRPGRARPEPAATA